MNDARTAQVKRASVDKRLAAHGLGGRSTATKLVSADEAAIRSVTTRRMPATAVRPKAKTMHGRERLGSGFSMLELVIVLAMAAVLSAYAVPAYVAYAARGHRIDAVIAVHRAAQHVVVNPPVAGRSLALPPGLDRAPEQGRPVYRLEWLSAAEGNGGYEIRAIPIDGGPMHGDACGTYVLDGLGARSNRGTADAQGTATDACWVGRAA